MPRRYVCRCFSSCSGADPARTTFQRRTIVKHLEHDRQRLADLVKSSSAVPPALTHATSVWAPKAFEEVAAVTSRVARDQSTLPATDDESSTADSLPDTDTRCNGIPDARARLLSAAVINISTPSASRKRPAEAADRSGEGALGGSKRVKPLTATSQPPLPLPRPLARPFVHGRQPVHDSRQPPTGSHWPAYASLEATRPAERGYSSLRTRARPATPFGHAATAIQTRRYARSPAFPPGSSLEYLARASASHMQALVYTQPYPASDQVDWAPTGARLGPYDPVFGDEAPDDDGYDQDDESLIVDYGFAFAPPPLPLLPPYASASSSFDAGTYSTSSPPSPPSLAGPPRPSSRSYNYVPLLPLACPPAHSYQPDYQPCWPDECDEKGNFDACQEARTAARESSPDDGGHLSMISTEAIARLTHDDLLRNATYRDLFFDHLALVSRSAVDEKVGKAEVETKDVVSPVKDEPTAALKESSSLPDLGTAETMADDDLLMFVLEPPAPDGAGVDAYKHDLDQPLPPPSLLAALPSDPPFVADGGPTVHVSPYERSPAASFLERLWAGM